MPLLLRKIWGPKRTRFNWSFRNTGYCLLPTPAPIVRWLLKRWRWRRSQTITTFDVLAVRAGRVWGICLFVFTWQFVSKFPLLFALGQAHSSLGRRLRCSLFSWSPTSLLPLASPMSRSFTRLIYLVRVVLSSSARPANRLWCYTTASLDVCYLCLWYL